MNLYKLHSEPESMEYYGFHHDTVPALFWNMYKHDPNELKKRENVIAKDPEYAYMYATTILKDRFLLGEEAISKDFVYAHWYAREILCGRFPLGEEAIAKDPIHAYHYAKDILHDRFPLGEEAIARVPMYAKCYAKEVIKGPWAINGKTYE